MSIKPKDPFTFATKSNGTYYGLNPLKIYNAQGKEIVQTLRGDTDTNGGITIVTELASSMLETVKNPNTFYATGVNNAVINQIELTKEVWDYYWTSYSRGTDGKDSPSNPNWESVYLNGYAQQKLKSVFDPCPYGFRIPVNGTYNMFLRYPYWELYSYIAGATFEVSNRTWIPVTGHRQWAEGSFLQTGAETGYISSTCVSENGYYGLYVSKLATSNFTWWESSEAPPLRCIEECSICMFY